MGTGKLPRWQFLTRVGILLGLVLLVAGFMVRDIRAAAFVQTDYVALGLWIAGLVLAVGGVVVNYRMVLGLVAARRTGERVNFALVVLLVLALAGLLCYISTRRFARVDWTAIDAVTGLRKHELHSQTENILRSLDADVEVTLLYFFTDIPALNQEIGYWLNTTRDMLEEFKARTGRVTVQEIDWTLSESQDTYQRFLRLLDEDSLPGRCVVFATSESHQVVPYDKTMRMARGGGWPDFTGEDAFATALVKLTEQEKVTVYALTGHGEKPLEAEQPALMPTPMGREATDTRSDPRYSLSRLVKELRNDNYEVKPLNLAVEGSVPEDCAALLIAGPTTPLTEAEIKALRTYFDDRNGGALILLDPQPVTRSASNLKALLADYGVRVHLDAVGVTNMQTPLGLLQTEEVPVPGEGLPDHAITSGLKGHTLVLQYACPVEVTGPALGGMLVAERLLPAPASWGEMDYQPRARRAAEYDPGQDVAPPIAVGAVVGPQMPPQAGPMPPIPAEDLPGPRLVVIGSSLSFVNAVVEMQPANLYLLQNSINWMAGKMHMLGIPPKSMELNLVHVTDSQIRASRYIFIGVVPACIIALGIGVWLVRRR